MPPTSSQPAPQPSFDSAPVTGAWQPGDDPGRRQFRDVVSNRPFYLEGGGMLSNITVAYETWGTLNEKRSNAILVCHALTGDSHAAGRADAGQSVGWWDGMIGPGKGIDTNEYFVVCANVLGGCQGTTGPASINPATNKPYGSSFPVVTIRDIVRVHHLLAKSLGIDLWRAVVGGSMGGMQALEWAVMYPHTLRSLVVQASSAAASAQQIAWSMVGRRAVLSDPNFCGGDYYDQPAGHGPHVGLALARQVAHIHYRSEEVFEDRFSRDLLDPLAEFTLSQRFQVEGYLDYQGEKFVRRFDANSYVRLNKAMDLHDLGRGRGSVSKALSRIAVPTLLMSIRSDMLYPPYQQEALRDQLRAHGVRVGFYEIDSPDGHDGFLTETHQTAPLVGAFLDAATPLE